MATVSGDPNKAVIFAYEAGAEMVGLTAPARRVGFFFQNYDENKYNFRGVNLFDAAVLWATQDTHFVGNSNYIEAEASSGFEGAFAYGADGTVSSGAYMTIPQGSGRDYDGDESPMGRLHFNLNVAAAGSYHVWLRVFGPDTGSDSFYVRMDGGVNEALHFGAQNGWLWKRVDGSFALAGEHTLTLSLREDGARVDKLLITDDPAFTPSGLGGH